MDALEHPFWRLTITSPAHIQRTFKEKSKLPFLIKTENILIAIIYTVLLSD
jgi:hypothetical protein